MSGEELDRIDLHWVPMVEDVLLKCEEDTGRSRVELIGIVAIAVLRGQVLRFCKRLARCDVAYLQTWSDQPTVAGSIFTAKQMHRAMTEMPLAVLAQTVPRLWDSWLWRRTYIALTLLVDRPYTYWLERQREIDSGLPLFSLLIIKK